MDTRFPATGSPRPTPRTATPPLTQLHKITPNERPPCLVERVTQAAVPAMPAVPSSSSDIRPRSSTPPQLQPAAEILTLPPDVLHRLIPFLRTEETLPAVRDLARFRAACKHLHRYIPEPISVIGFSDFYGVDVMRQVVSKV